jgi:hypothetical protein
MQSDGKGKVCDEMDRGAMHSDEIVLASTKKE